MVLMLLKELNCPPGFQTDPKYARSCEALLREPLYTQKSDPQHQHNTLGSRTRLELRSAEREQWQGEHTTIGRKSEWIILGSLLAEVLSIYFSKLRSNMLTAKYCRAATVSASPFIRKNATLEKVSRLCG